MMLIKKQKHESKRKGKRSKKNESMVLKRLKKIQKQPKKESLIQKQRTKRVQAKMEEYLRVLS